jgi:hypothetical protein
MLSAVVIFHTDEIKLWGILIHEVVEPSLVHLVLQIVNQRGLAKDTKPSINQCLIEFKSIPIKGMMTVKTNRIIAL